MDNLFRSKLGFLVRPGLEPRRNVIVRDEDKSARSKLSHVMIKLRALLRREGYPLRCIAERFEPGIMVGRVVRRTHHVPTLPHAANASKLGLLPRSGLEPRRHVIVRDEDKSARSKLTMS